MAKTGRPRSTLNSLPLSKKKAPPPGAANGARPSARGAVQARLSEPDRDRLRELAFRRRTTIQALIEDAIHTMLASGGV